MYCEAIYCRRFLGIYKKNKEKFRCPFMFFNTIVYLKKKELSLDVLHWEGHNISSLLFLSKHKLSVQAQKLTRVCQRLYKVPDQCCSNCGLWSPNCGTIKTWTEEVVQISTYKEGKKWGISVWAGLWKVKEDWEKKNPENFNKI